jgi:hypothetical protein
MKRRRLKAIPPDAPDAGVISETRCQAFWNITPAEDENNLLKEKTQRSAKEACQKIRDDAPNKSKVPLRNGPKGSGSVSGFQRFLKRIMKKMCQCCIPKLKNKGGKT